MGYPEFEKIFLSFCKKEFSLPNDYYCLNGMSLLNSAENIDRYILLPAGFSQENRDKYLGIDLNVLTKDLLSRYRKGRRKLANYIKNTYSSDEAVERTEKYFSIVVPRVMNNSDRQELLLELSSIAEIKLYTSVPSSIIEDDIELKEMGKMANTIAPSQVEDKIYEEQIKKLARCGFINNEAVLRKENNNWVSYGDSIDIAFLALGMKANVDEEKAMELFYKSNTYMLMSKGISDFHCLSDAYLADDILLEEKK